MWCLRADPLFTASRQALTTLGAVTQHINEPNAYDLIRREFADPKLRDAALSAVGQLAPSGRRGISSLEIGGRALPQGRWRLLTPETRLQVRAWLEQPVVSNEVVELRGRVRAIDLDLRRFDLRRVDEGNLPDLRCIYPDSFDVPAKKWLDATVVVRGHVETYQGIARLLQVQSVEEYELSISGIVVFDSKFQEPQAYVKAMAAEGISRNRSRRVSCPLAGGHFPLKLVHPVHPECMEDNALFRFML